MKKNYLFSALAASLMLFASCSQEEIISTVGDEPTGGQLVRISASLPQEAATRAMATVTNYKARCIMQLVDASGVAISDERYVEEVQGDQVTFEFTAPDQAYQCVFWADYIQENAATLETDYFYTTTALPAVTLSSSLNKNVMFGSEAASAFCGVITDPANGLNIMLKRPVAKINIGSNAPENYTGYDQVRVDRMNIPNNYNILTKTTDVSQTQEIRLENTAMIDAAAGDWTYFFVFAPVTQTTYTFDIPVTITDAAGSLEAKSATVSVVPVDDNVESNINFTPEGGSGEDPDIDPDNDMQINVSFDGEYEDPNALKVGDYIDATGAKVTDASSAVAVVFALAEGKVDASTYGEGNTVEAYAVSLTKAAGRAYLKDGSAGTWTPTLVSTATMDTESPYSGYQMSSDMLTAVGDYASNLFTAYNSWVSSSSISNTSGWYIPSYAQLQDILTLDNATLKEALNGAYGSTYFLISSSVNADLTIHGSTYDPTEGVVQNANQNIDPTTHQGIIFPVVTIFE